MHVSLLFLFCSLGFTAASEAERTAKQVMDYHLVMIRDYSRYRDYTSLQTLFEYYPKEWDTEQKWPEVMNILKEYEFKTHDAQYSAFDSQGNPTEISGKVTFMMGNKNLTDVVRLKKDSANSVTEWKMKNQMLKPRGMAAFTPWYCYFSLIICYITGKVEH